VSYGTVWYRVFLFLLRERARYLRYLRFVAGVFVVAVAVAVIGIIAVQLILAFGFAIFLACRF